MAIQDLQVFSRKTVQHIAMGGYTFNVVYSLRVISDFRVVLGKIGHAQMWGRFFCMRGLSNVYALAIVISHCDQSHKNQNNNYLCHIELKHVEKR